MLTKTLAVVSLLAPASGHPLGIGEIKLHSALNQNLDAEIALTLSGESVSDIKVNLAPPEKFDEAGVSWTYFLSKIKFETITQSNGSAVIKLTSKEVLKEPFLDFLLEVSWPKGNLYREFTVLVDPPSVYNQATIPVSTGTESTAQSSAVAAQPQLHANGQSSNGQYGPTLANDTLWSVAERVRGQSDVSVEQMMIALYEANPHAFHKGNVYALTTGKILKIPEREAALKISRNQAIAEFNQHTQAWKKHAAPAHAESAKKKPAQSGTDGAAQNKAEAPADNQLKLIAPTKAAVSDHAGVTSEQVSIGKKTTDAATDSAIQSKVVELEKQLAMMQALIALKDQQLAAMQNQSSQANPVVQDQTAPSEAAAAKPADQAAVVPQSAEPAQAVQPAAPVQPTQPQQLSQPVQPVGPVQPVQPTEAVKPVQPAEQVKPVQPVAQPEPPEANSVLDPFYLGGAGAAILSLLGGLWWRKRKIDQETNTESMFASSSMIETSEAEEKVSVPVVEDGATAHEHDAGTVGESSFLSEFTPSDFDSFDTDQGEIDPISEADVYLAYGRYQQAEELIRQAISDQPNRDECKLKLLEVFYANENKTAFEAYANELAEAGKRNEAEFWEKAAEMGREICPDSPLFSSGNDLFAVADNSADEDAEEGVVAAAAGDIGANKEHVDAGAVSFEESVNEDVATEMAESENDAQDFDLTSTEAESDSFADEQQNNQDIDFDLNSFSMESDEADQGLTAPNTDENKSFGVDEIEQLDFDLSSFSMDSEGADQGLASSNADENKSSGVEIEQLDFDLGSFSMGANDSDEAGNDFSAPNKTQEFESLEFDFSSDAAVAKETDDLDFSALDNGDKSHQDADFSADSSLDFNDDLGSDFDFNFDLDLPTSTSGQDSGQQDEFGVSDLTDMDELETKLDLAKAYVDMGDADAAKDIAREVLEQGSAEQKKIAQALLDELD